MKDFDEFVDWYNESCAEELQAELDRMREESRAAGPEDKVRALGAMLDLRSKHRLRKYHEWLSSQL